VIGCIVLKSEHREVNNRRGNEENPWLRYKGSVIKLVPNPEWPGPHLKMIEDAGLV
jgi:hypothetical protein